MNQASQWRQALAETFAPTYRVIPQVQAVLLSGSVARGLADQTSDIELTVFWERAPTDAERVAAAEHGGGTLVDLYPYEEENGDWSEDVYVRGVEFAISHRLVKEVEGWLADVVERFDTSLAKQDLISIIQYSYPLHGAALVEAWRARVAEYPLELARAMVQAHLHFKSAWNRLKLVERDELLLFYEDACAAEKGLLLALMGLNHVYLPHLGFKWLDQLADSLPVAPANLRMRLRQVFRAPPREAAANLNGLIEETFDLVAQRMPDVDIAASRAAFRYARPTWDAPPPASAP